MIRINLFEETRVQARKARGRGMGMPSLDVAENVGIVVMLGGIALAAGVVLILFVINKGKIADLDRQIAKAEVEKKRLEFVLKESERLKARQAEIQRRLEIIRQLKANQDKPVRMMLELSKELSKAENVWFEDLTFSGDHLQVRGKALSKINYSGMLANLEKSDCFDDVRMGITEERETPDGTLVSFRLETDFVPECGKPAAGGGEGGRSGRSGRSRRGVRRGRN